MDEASTIRAPIARRADYQPAHSAVELYWAAEGRNRTQGTHHHHPFADLDRRGRQRQDPPRDSGGDRPDRSVSRRRVVGGPRAADRRGAGATRRRASVGRARGTEPTTEGNAHNLFTPQGAADLPAAGWTPPCA